MRRTLPLLCLFLGLLSLAACGPKGTDITRFGLPDGTLSRDLAALPQDLAGYAERVGKNTRLLDAERQTREDERFNRRFFAAWDDRVGRLPKDHVFEAVAALDPAGGFAENLRPFAQERWRELVANCLMDAYGETPVRPAITVETTHLRRLPTDAPYFLNPGSAGEGFPFDYLQNSALWAGTPVSIGHISRDGLWAYVQTRLVSGWAKTASLAVVDKSFIRAWTSRPLGVIIKDNVELAVADRKRDAVSNGAKTLTAGTGAVFPFAGTAARGLMPPRQTLQAPLRGSDGRAEIATALAPVYAVRKKPLPLTPDNLALVGNAMMGQPYGWGGLFGNRDCSALMVDLFAPFGIWLPRNSRDQGRTGARLDLSGLTPERKEERILREGIPFLSLVSLPGHVGLYIGSYPEANAKGEVKDVPVMFHSLWGLRVVSGSGNDAREGRGVVGKAVVTTLRPGAEHPSIASPASLLDRILGLAILPED